MPELPDVEVFRRTVQGDVVPRVVETVAVPSDDLLMDTSRSSLRAALRGHRVTATVRHGKHLFLRSGEDRHRWLRLHFGMSGSVRVWCRDEEDAPDHVYLRLDLRGGRTLGYRCPRKLGEIGLVEDPSAFVDDAGLGPDAWGGALTGRLRSDAVGDLLAGCRGMVKTTLMDQRVLAGLGNVYVDEALFHAGVHPETAVDALDGRAVEDLWATVQWVLEEAVESGADPDGLPDDWLLPAREARPCPRCPGTIRRSEVSGRATFACDTHQEKR